MRRILGSLLLLIAPLAFSAPAEREPFPADYVPSPCANVDKVCVTFPKAQISDIAAIRGFDLGSDWVFAHWDELTTALKPTCAKIATCFATPGNDYLFCNDVLNAEAFGLCDRYPAGSVDHQKCIFFMTAYLLGHDRNSKPEWMEMQSCAAARKTSGEARTLDVWIGNVRSGQFTVYAIDAETRVPVQAALKVQSRKPVYAEDVPNGLPTANYPLKWDPKPVRVPDAQGHQKLVSPQIEVVKEGYRTETLTIPLTVPEMKVQMTPAAAKLKRGRNRVTISAVDSVTGAPVDARVMAGQVPAGKTNVPFELEIGRDGKRPELWLTSLYDAYSDVVVAPAK